tara:strand:- start:548 stop:1672 length:1125 start_codon:yes stop_codon:yes gene_type:complete
MINSTLIKKLTNFVINFFKIFFITFILILGIDFFLGNKILEIIDPYIKETEFYDKRIKIWDNTFHHTFKKNVNMKSTGIETNNRFCTNNFGFKSNCNFTKTQNYKFGFMGDSFTEGLGLNYENTFVGIFEKNLGSEVANMGVSSYSPKLHLAKINFFLSKGVSFDHVILFLDISDYYDEAFYQFDETNLSVVHNKKDLRRIWAKKNFPFTNYYFYVVKKNRNSLKPEKKTLVKNLKVVFDESVKRKTSWLNKDIKKYEINEKTVFKIHEDTKYYVNRVYEILKEKNIKFSLAIYPWPQNLLNKQNNVYYRSEWKNFCEARCDHFFDYFDDFNYYTDKDGYEEVYKKFYIWNDIHFNKKGNILLADKIIKRLLDK